MRIRTTDCCLTQKGSGIVVMHEQLNQNECRILICSVQDFLARQFSIAGKREGFADARGTLFFEIARLLKS